MKTDELSLSVIIISYNTKEITENCLKSIFASLQVATIPYEIIIIDNASTDGSIEMLRKLKENHSNLSLIENKNNVGFARANNQAVKYAKGEYLLFLNSDIIVLDKAIEKLFNYFKANEGKVNFLGGKLLNKDGSSQASCGPFYSLPIVFTALFLRGDYWGATRSSPNAIKEVDWISGACILTKKESFEKISGFDENIFMYMDEIDLLYRAKRQGFKVFFYPEARFIHLGSASSGNRTYPILQVYKGLLYFYKKHYGASSVLLLTIMLQLKANIAIFIGKITGNIYLLKTYGEARKLATMA